MLRGNITAILARNETCTGHAATEPFEAGWATEAVIFVRAPKPPVGPRTVARIRISPDRMHWADEGTRLDLPTSEGELRLARVQGFGNWLRLAAGFPDGASACVLVTLHLKG